ncbi:MAG: hypothetical protein A2X49_02040 [Lentisphaerae bacterium GWF2_52_8]|nr:MAG: hypothetical protein A2X49_02040 [Lentisphaerae bacterium GWF2_52_8]
MSEFEDKFAELMEGQLLAGRPIPKILQIYIGNASAQSLRNVRAQSREESFLLYLCDPTPQADYKNAELIRESISLPGPPTLIESTRCPLSEISEKIWFLASCLNCLEIRQGLEVSEMRHEKLLQNIKSFSSDALLNVQHVRSSMLIKLRCTLHNLPLILKSPLREAHLDSPSPAIICGAGPSLDEQLGMIRKSAGKTVIIAVGRIAPKLEASGIIPDFTVQIDPETNETQTLTACETLVALTQVSPSAARLFKRIVWHQGDLACAEKLLESLGSPLPKLEVAHTSLLSAIDFAALLGCPKIALVGSDLCLGKTGESHSSGYADDTRLGGEKLEVTGYDGSILSSTPEFQKLQAGIERYLARKAGFFKEKNLRIFNCSARGALIAGTERMELCEFIKEFASKEKRIGLVEKAPAPANAASSMEALRNAFAEYAAALARRLDAHKSLQREFETPSPNHEERITRLLAHRRIQEEAEARCKANPILAGLPASLSDFVSSTFASRQGQTGDELSARNLRAMAECRFLLYLAEELGADIEESSKKLRGQTATHPRNPIIFDSFLRMGHDIIAEKNPELAEFILKEPSKSSAARFSLYLNWQNPPHVRMFDADGKSHELCAPYLTMEKDADAAVSEFIRSKAFDPQRHALIFVAPGNWLHVLALARKSPSAALLVLDPWPELLSLLCRHSLFLHLLPPSATIAGAGNDCPGWPKLCQDTILSWRKSGKDILFFEAPHCCKLPEAMALSAELKKLAEEPI